MISGCLLLVILGVVDFSFIIFLVGLGGVSGLLWNSWWSNFF